VLTDSSKSRAGNIRVLIDSGRHIVVGWRAVVDWVVTRRIERDDVVVVVIVRVVRRRTYACELVQFLDDILWHR
jgi:hypothetical protein